MARLRTLGYAVEMAVAVDDTKRPCLQAQHALSPLLDVFTGCRTVTSHEPTYLHLDTEQRLRPIYRFVPQNLLFALFRSRENVVVSPTKWDDPFENFLSRVPGAPRQHWYGQCWTRNKASDAMWRIYSPQKTAVRIRTTPRKLEMASRDPLWRVFVGRVQYPSEGDIEKAFLSAKGGRVSDLKSAETLLVKRRAFQHEGEVRLLIHAPKLQGKNGVLSYAVDPHALVDQIMLDPRLSPDEAGDLKRLIKEQTGFRGRIMRSLLYQPPEVRWKE